MVSRNFGKAVNNTIPAREVVRRLSGRVIRFVTFRPLPAWARALLVLLAVSVSAAAAASAETAARIVVLDPGHGGHDAGAVDPGGVFEKEVTLAFSRRLETELASRWQVVMTRDGDYRLSPGERAGTANRVRADLLLSIHAGGSFSRQTRGMTLYTSASGTPSGDDPASSASSAPPAGAGQDPVAWDGLQDRHAPGSRRLAHLLQHYLTVAAQRQPEAAGIPVEIVTVPLAVLRGADMPAVLVEIGTLTNPNDAALLGRQDHLARLSTAIANSVTDFFHDKSTISSSDLKP